MKVLVTLPLVDNTCADFFFLYFLSSTGIKALGRKLERKTLSYQNHKVFL